MRLLQAAISGLAQESQLKSSLRAVLVQAVSFLGADAGLLLQQEGGAFTVQAAYGDVLPPGAQIPLGGVLGTVLKSPFPLSFREHVESRLRVSRSQKVALELLVPMQYAGKGVGVLALMRQQGQFTVTEDDLNALRALATLLAMAVSTSSNGARTKSQRREGNVSLAQLTPREQQVLALLPRGYSNAEIAQELSIAPGTAKIHVERILHKLGLRDRTQAAVRASEWGHRL